jgi:hypothetical protein
MKTKFTAGPWLVSDAEHEGIADDDYHFIRAGDGIYGSTEYTGFEISGLMNVHEARLIAAAPDLLEAVETLLDCFVNDPLGWMDSSDIAIEKAYDAIHKAKGE